jgi:hypothetical protein
MTATVRRAPSDQFSGAVPRLAAVARSSPHSHSNEVLVTYLIAHLLPCGVHDMVALHGSHACS